VASKQEIFLEENKYLDTVIKSIVFYGCFYDIAISFYNDDEDVRTKIFVFNANKAARKSSSRL
jgi:hypothetical protein